MFIMDITTIVELQNFRAKTWAINQAKLSFFKDPENLHDLPKSQAAS